MDEEESELDPREAALAATPILQPDFKSSKFTQSQLDKFKEQDDEVATSVPRKKKKLHWGLEAKERWERKANM